MTDIEHLHLETLELKIHLIILSEIVKELEAVITKLKDKIDVMEITR